MSKPIAKCPNCEQSAEYVRTRYFHDGSSHVFWCGNRECKSHDLYFHTDGKDVCQECGGSGQFKDSEGMPELCEKCMGDGGKQWGGDTGWRRVSFAGDCIQSSEWEGTDELGDICSLCGLDYCEKCECPGPTQDGMEYETFHGVLMARPESVKLPQAQNAEKIPLVP